MWGKAVGLEILQKQLRTALVESSFGDYCALVIWPWIKKLSLRLALVQTNQRVLTSSLNASREKIHDV